MIGVWKLSTVCHCGWVTDTVIETDGIDATILAEQSCQEALHQGHGCPHRPTVTARRTIGGQAGSGPLHNPHIG
jgi:hypothetical protein